MLCNRKTLEGRDQVFQKKTKKKIRQIWLKADSNFVKQTVIRPNKSPQNQIQGLGKEKTIKNQNFHNFRRL
jgi:hypothetical protein